MRSASSAHRGRVSTVRRTRNRAPSRTNSKKSFKPFRKDRRAVALLSINSRSTDTHMSFISLISRRATTMSIFVPRVRAALIWHKGNYNSPTLLFPKQAPQPQPTRVCGRRGHRLAAEWVHGVFQSRWWGDGSLGVLRCGR